MLRRLQALPEYQGAFLSGDDAFLRVQPETLLVVVDTNRPGSVESEPLLDACNRWRSSTTTAGAAATSTRWP